MNSMELLGGRGWGGYKALLLSVVPKGKARKSLRNSVNCEWRWWLMGCSHGSTVIEISFKFPFLFTAISLLCWMKSCAFQNMDNEIHILKVKKSNMFLWVLMCLLKEEFCYSNFYLKGVSN